MLRLLLLVSLIQAYAVAQLFPGALSGGGTYTSTPLDSLITNQRPPIFFVKFGSTMKQVGIMHSFLYSAGNPLPGVAPSPGLAGEALTTLSGQIPFANASAGKNVYVDNVLLSGTTFSLTGHVFVIADRLWQNSGIDVTSLAAQTINSVAWPARDANGSTNGADIFIGVECSAATSNGSSTTMSVSYTNSAGVAGRTGTITLPATISIGTVARMQMQAGDTGVRSIQTITLAASLVSGAIHLVALRQLIYLGIPAATSEPVQINLLGGNVKLYDNTVPTLYVIPGNTTGTTFSGFIQLYEK